MLQGRDSSREALIFHWEILKKNKIFVILRAKHYAVIKKKAKTISHDLE